MTTSRRLVPLPLLLIALAALCTLLFAPEVQAQTATVLVKNTDQTTHTPLSHHHTCPGIHHRHRPRRVQSGIHRGPVRPDRRRLRSTERNHRDHQRGQRNRARHSLLHPRSPIRLCCRLRQHLRRIRLLHSLPEHHVLRSPDPHRHLRRRQHMVRADGQRQRGRYPRHRLVHS